MKTKIRRAIEKFQRRIERQLERENQKRDEDERPVICGTGAAYEVASRVRATPAGGI